MIDFLCVIVVVKRRREAKINGDPGKKNTRACVYIVTQKYTARAR